MAFPLVLNNINAFSLFRKYMESKLGLEVGKHILSLTQYTSFLFP